MTGKGGYMTSIWTDQETKEKLCILTEELGLRGWGSLVKEAINTLWDQRQNAPIKENIEDRKIVLNAKIDERLTGDLVGSFIKEMKKLKATDEAENAGMTHERAEQVRSNTRAVYSKSREAMYREFDRMIEGTKEWFIEQIKATGAAASAASKESQSKSQVNNQVGLQKETGKMLFHFKCRCGSKWSKLYFGSAMLNDVCKNCGALCTSRVKK